MLGSKRIGIKVRNSEKKYLNKIWSSIRGVFIKNKRGFWIVKLFQI